MKFRFLICKCMKFRITQWFYLTLTMFWWLNITTKIKLYIYNYYDVIDKTIQCFNCLKKTFLTKLAVTKYLYIHPYYNGQDLARIMDVNVCMVFQVLLVFFRKKRNTVFTQCVTLARSISPGSASPHQMAYQMW